MNEDIIQPHHCCRSWDRKRLKKDEIINTIIRFLIKSGVSESTITWNVLLGMCSACSRAHKVEYTDRCAPGTFQLEDGQDIVLCVQNMLYTLAKENLPEDRFEELQEAIKALQIEMFKKMRESN